MEDFKVQQGAVGASNFPWLVFKSLDNDLAINCESVVSITILPEDITHIPHMPNYMRGVLNLRGSIVPLLDVGRLFGSQETTASRGLDTRYINDHRKWVETLMESINAGKPFTLAIDPHRCGFGIWYDNYKPSNNLLAHHLKKIDAPHKRLHEVGAGVVKLMADGDSQKNKDKIEELAKEVKEELEPLLLRLLEQTAKMVAESLREMVVVFEYGSQKIGLIVDEVHSVEHLSFLSRNENDVKSSYGSNYVKGIGKSTKSDQMILIVDEISIADTFSQANVEVEPASAGKIK